MKNLILKFVFCFVFLLCTLYSVAQKGNYEQIATFAPPHLENERYKTDREYNINGFKLSESGRFLVVDYGYNNSLIAIYDIDSITVKMAGMYSIGSVADIENTYFSENEQFLYVKHNRYSSDYKQINIETKTIQDINCSKTPRGCTANPEGLPVIQMYSPNKKYYFVRNSNDKSTLHIYRQTE